MKAKITNEETSLEDIRRVLKILVMIQFRLIPKQSDCPRNELAYYRMVASTVIKGKDKSNREQLVQYLAQENMAMTAREWLDYYRAIANITRFPLHFLYPFCSLQLIAAVKLESTYSDQGKLLESLPQSVHSFFLPSLPLFPNSKITYLKLAASRENEQKNREYSQNADLCDAHRAVILIEKSETAEQSSKITMLREVCSILDRPDIVKWLDYDVSSKQVQSI